VATALIRINSALSQLRLFDRGFLDLHGV